MFRLVRIGALTLGCLALAAPAHGEGPLADGAHAVADGVTATVRGVADAFNGIVRDVKRRQCWPKPFTEEDQETVVAPFIIMVANGWQRQNTLDDNYFEEGTGQLSEAGRLKVRWILTQAPEQHRGVYVLRAATPAETMARIGAVNQFCAQMLPPGAAQPVELTDVTPRGWPAARVDSIGRNFEKVTPPPKLPMATASLSGSSSGQ
jgi:hypothetical protein